MKNNQRTTKEQPKNNQRTTKEQSKEKKMSWFSRGFRGEHVEQAEKEMKRERKIFHFYLKAGEESEIMLLDDVPFAFWWHQVWSNGKLLTLACRKGVSRTDPGCYTCEKGINRQYIFALTAIQLTPIVTRSGDEIVNSIKLFPMTKRTRNKFMSRKDRLGSLVGIPIICARSSNKAPKVGDDFQFEKDRKTDPFTDKACFRKSRDGKLFPPEIIDYENVFYPYTNAEMKRMLEMHHQGESESWDNGDSSDSKEYNDDGPERPPVDAYEDDLPF